MGGETVLKIIIVDDDTAELSTTSGLVRQYAADRKGLDPMVQCFSTPRDFRRWFVAGGRADVYILDIVMPETDGISLGLEIKRAERDADIIYLTTSAEYGVASYDVQATDYILKPCTAKCISRALDRVTAAQSRERALCFFVRMADGVYSIPHADILYVEYSDHRLIVYTTDGRRIESVSCREPFTVLAETLLRERNFLRISVSFIINMKHVIKLSSNEFEMQGHIKLPISRSYPSSRSAYMNFILDQN